MKQMMDDRAMSLCEYMIELTWLTCYKKMNIRSNEMCTCNNDNNSFLRSLLHFLQTSCNPRVGSRRPNNRCSFALFK